MNNFENNNDNVNSNTSKKAVHVKWAGKTIALGTFSASEADEKCARAKALTRAWRSTMRPKPTREWVMLELERLQVRVVSGRSNKHNADGSESDGEGSTDGSPQGHKNNDDKSSDHVIPPHRPLVGGGSAAAYEAARADHYRTLAEQKKSKSDTSLTEYSKANILSVSRQALVQSSDTTNANLGGEGQQHIVTASKNLLPQVGLSVNPNQHYEMLKLHHINLLNEIQETTLMMNLYQQQQQQLQEQQQQQLQLQQQKKQLQIQQQQQQLQEQQQQEKQQQEEQQQLINAKNIADQISLLTQQQQQQQQHHQQQQQHQQQLTSPLNETGSVRPQQFPNALNDNDITTDMRNSYQLNNTGIKNVADISNSARRLSNDIGGGLSNAVSSHIGLAGNGMSNGVENIGGNLGLGGFPNKRPNNNTFGRINSLGGENEHYLNHIQNEPLGNNKQFGSNNLDGHNNNNNQTGMVNNFNIPNNSGVPNGKDKTNQGLIGEDSTSSTAQQLDIPINNMAHDSERAKQTEELNNALRERKAIEEATQDRLRRIKEEIAERQKMLQMLEAPTSNKDDKRKGNNSISTPSNKRVKHESV